MNRLCIFARTPRLGQVKQRLAADLGDAEALAAHELLLERALARCLGSDDYSTELWLTELDDVTEAAFARPGLSLHPQPTGDLGERMEAVLMQGFEKGERAVLMGGDCPDIDRGYVQAAFAALRDADVVIGPAEDGGYGLIGLRGSVPGLFDGVSWGTADVLRETLERASGSAASVTLLDEIYDVDTPADWARFRRATGAPTQETESE